MSTMVILILSIVLVCIVGLAKVLLVDQSKCNKRGTHAGYCGTFVRLPEGDDDD
jgi:hypothetical protein